ncbi:uncharacterized protein LOC134836581, partial [Culicoides brevitarsis]|uniref:uncharacterized protein LOC134836581 n=1 Tax=Culicoides brevitarsis TaxID=469753 RepID=UPI00307C3D15
MDHRELEILNSTLRNLIVELQLEKTTIRNKAFTVLQDLLDRRSVEINELINSDSFDSDITWSGLFMASLEGMHQQVLKIKATATTATLENKCGMYSHVMMRLVSVANANFDQIPKKILLEKSLEILERNPDMEEYFGNCLFTVIDRYLVLSTGVWHNVKASLYNMYLKILFQIVEKSVTNNFYVTCLCNAIDVGVQHLNVSSALEAHLVPLLMKIEAEPSESGKMNLLKVAYLIAFETVVNKRIITCQFMFQLAKNLLVTYNPTRIRDEHRIYIIKILDLIIVAETLTENPKALSPENWNTLLQGCTFIVEQEIDRMDRSTYRLNSNNAASDAIFYDFAAKVCALTFWDSEIWSTGSEQPLKRMKYLGKYPALISRVETTSSNHSSRYKFSWRWMLILGKVLETHPERIESDDYEQILQLLAEFQPTIQKPEHFQGFYLACRALLEHETPEKVFGDEKKIAEHWHKIVETAARNCSSINQTSNENLMLIRLMMRHKKHNGEVFIESLLDTYFTNSINRSDESIQTLIALLLTFNINVLKDPADKIEKILSYLLEKQRVNAKTSILKSQEKPKAELVARLIVICNMYKSTLNAAFKEKWLQEALGHGQELWVNSEYEKYKSSIESIKDAILIQLLQKPIFDETEIDSSDHSMQKSATQESLCVIDDASFLSFCHKIMPIESQMACSQAADDQEDVPDLMQEKLYNTSVLVNAFNIFLQIRAIHLEKIEEFQLAKRIGIIVGTLEQDFQTLDGTERYRPKYEMLRELTEIFATRYDEAVLRFVRQLQWTNCFNWIAKIIEQGIQGNRDMESDKRMLLKKLPLQILAAYLTVEGCETVRAENFFHTCLEAKTNVLQIDETSDVEVLLELLATLVVSKRESEVLAEDISSFTALLLRKHFLNIGIIEKFMPILPDFLKYFKNTSEERIHEVVMIVQGLVKAAQNLYPLSLILKILSSVFRFFVKEYPSYGNIKSFCDLLFDFTNSSCTRTRIASVRAFLFMIHPRWARYDNERAFLELDEFFKDIIEENLADFREMQDDPDTKSSKMAIATQLFCTVICISYQLRHKATLAFLDICDLSQPTSMREVTMQEYLKILDNAMTHDIFQLFRDNIKHLLSHWIINEYPFSKFPFYVTGAESLEDFFNENLATMAIAIFTSNDSMLPKLCQSTNNTEEELLREVIPDLMIEILPFLSTPDKKMPSEKVEKAEKLIGKIQKLPDHVRILNESLDKILELLIQRLFDEDFIKNFLHTKVNSVGNDTLSHQNLTNCCNYLKKNIQHDSSNDPILVTLCQKSPFKVQKLFLATEIRLSSAISHEQKIVCLSQYVWIFENIKIFIARPSKNDEMSALKEFFIMNMVHVICDQINSNVDAVSKAAFYYFRKICEENLPIGTCFTFIVHSFVQNINKTGNEKMIEFLETLLGSQNFTSEIILLPDFPNNQQFRHLQERVTVVRDAMNQNTLEAQIEQFFKIEYLTVETLKSLQTSLATRKTEVLELYENAKKVRFSNEVNESVLHRLVAKLVSIVEGLDAEKGYEASRCLGELGAANLNTLALYDQSEHTCYKATESEEEAILVIHQTLLNCLKDSIIDKDVKVKCAANEAAFQLALTVNGRGLLEENSLLRWFLLIPKPRKQSILDTNINLAPLSNVFVQNRRETYKIWIQIACKQLLQVFNDTTIVPLVMLKPEFAENLLPAVIKLILALDDKALLTSLNSEMQKFFSEFYATIKSGEESAFYRDKSIVKAMLMVFECCRIEDRCSVLPRIRIDYLHLLKAAEFCNASFSCILYSQLWASWSAASSKTNEIFVDVKPHEEVCASLRHAYHEVGIEDAEFHLLDPLRDKQQYLIANGAWTQALQEFDWNAANRQVLRENGFYELLAKESHDGGTKYEMAWRLSDFSLFDEKEFKNDLNGAFEKSHYEALKCLHQNDKTGVLRNIKTA